MRNLGADALRQAYLDFFASKGHLRLPSASLVPHGDPTLLFTAAGMVPFKPYFLGQATPPQPRITTAQRCVRTPDIDSVGLTTRHGTFFEMLGNFSFGDYFKREAIQWAWEFVTQHLGLAPDRLWVTIYTDDDEAFAIWHEEVGVPAERIVRLGKSDNFWEIGVGPCGPCSEIHVDRGPQMGCGRSNCRPGCDECERFLEIWNLVFIQYHQDEAGQLVPLAKKGIDTGMGLERTAAFLQNVNSIFEVDLIRPIVDAIARRAGTEYGRNEKSDVSIRVITDHVRGITFMVHDGILPSNEKAGYVLRRLLRRAVRHGQLLGIRDPFLADMVDVVAKQMQVGYPEILENIDFVKRVVAAEEARFQATLEQGMGILSELITQAEAEGRRTISGEDAFRLHDTFGFPVELTEEMCADRGLDVDRAGFEAAMARQRELARMARGEKGYLGDAQVAYAQLVAGEHSRFVGYEQLAAEATVMAIIRGAHSVEAVTVGDEVEIVLNVTPFYAESGGQVSDTGTITGAEGEVVIDRVERVGGGVIVHRGRVVAGRVAIGDRVVAAVTAHERAAIARNHTATHLLHQALHDILGDHANQAGSLVAPDRLRFDFTHFAPVRSEELHEVEQRVNARILQNLPVTTQVTDFASAKALGARALFGEKYGDKVRVVKIGDYSIELCGGTHVASSGEIGLFKIVSEGSVAQGVRRIEAVTGQGALRQVRELESALGRAADHLQVSPREVPQQVEKILLQVRDLERELNALRARLAAQQGDRLLAQAELLGSLRLIISAVEVNDAAELRALGDRLRDRLGPSVLVLGTAKEGKVSLLAMASPEAVRAGVHAGKIISQVAPLVGGRGGGRPERAEGGGGNTTGLGEALVAARALVEQQYSAASRA